MAITPTNLGGRPDTGSDWRRFQGFWLDRLEQRLVIEHVEGADHARVEGGAGHPPDLPDRSRAHRPRVDEVHPLLGHRVASPLKDVLFDARIDTDALGFLADHRVYGNVVVPAAVIASGTLQTQRVIVGTLESIVAEVAKAKLEPPATLIVGDVVRVRDLLSLSPVPSPFGRGERLPPGQPSGGVEKSLASVGNFGSAA